MPLIKGGSRGAVSDNIKTEMNAGKPQRQAVAIALDVARRSRKAAGGSSFPVFKPPMNNQPFLRNQERQLTHTGPIMSSVPGRTDMHPMNVPSGAYVVPAHAVSHLGQSNTIAGMGVLSKMFGPSGGSVTHGHGAPPPPKLMGVADMGGARGRGDDGDVPIMAAGGEFIIAPEKVAEIGGGDIKRGHKILDQWMKQIQKDHAKTIAKLPGPAKD